MSESSQPEQFGQTAVRAAGDRTIGQYESWMQTNAAAHLLRAARQSGIVSTLRKGQHTFDQLCETLSLDPITTGLVLDALVAIGFVEQYGDDYALARAGHLLCQYDEDLGDSRWQRLQGRLVATDSNPELDPSEYRNHLAATQWIHTSSAMQAAEILNFGASGPEDRPRILDLGCGAAVWSSAMAHRHPHAEVVVVDNAASLGAARSTADSIELGERFKTIDSDPRTVTVGDNSFDLVILAQLLSGYDEQEAAAMLGKATAALKPGGRLVAPDHYQGPGKAGLTETISRLTIRLSTPAGRVRDLRECQQMFLDAGLQSVQFTYLAASQSGLGMIVAEKP